MSNKIFNLLFSAVVILILIGCSRSDNSLERMGLKGPVKKLTIRTSDKSPSEFQQNILSQVNQKAVHEFDSKGNLTATKYYSSSDILEKMYEYKTHDKLKEERVFDANTKLVQRIEYRLNSKGLPIETKTFDSLGKLTNRRETTYDDNMRPLTEKVYLNDQLSELHKYDYNQELNLQYVRVYDNQNDLIRDIETNMKTKSHVYRTYDGKGNIINTLYAASEASLILVDSTDFDIHNNWRKANSKSYTFARDILYY